MVQLGNLYFIKQAFFDLVYNNEVPWEGNWNAESKYFIDGGAVDYTSSAFYIFKFIVAMK